MFFEGESWAQASAAAWHNPQCLAGHGALGERPQRSLTLLGEHLPAVLLVVVLVIVALHQDDLLGVLCRGEVEGSRENRGAGGISEANRCKRGAKGAHRPTAELRQPGSGERLTNVELISCETTDGKARPHAGGAAQLR